LRAKKRENDEKNELALGLMILSSRWIFIINSLKLNILTLTKCIPNLSLVWLAAVKLKDFSPPKFQ
jgi:hypothetical protein